MDSPSPGCRFRLEFFVGIDSREGGAGNKNQNAEAALAELKAGNERYATGTHLRHIHDYRAGTGRACVESTSVCYRSERADSPRVSPIGHSTNHAAAFS